MPNLLQIPLCLFQHTGVFRLRCNLCEKLNKVRKVIAEEFGTDDKVFARVVGEDVGSQKLGFTLDSNGRASFSTLFAMEESAILS